MTNLDDLQLCPLTAELARTAPAALTPRAFFVSWQGVLTLAYAGFPEPLRDLKSRLSAAIPSLPRENPGSKWPKTTLGCLREGKRLDRAELADLLRICREHEAALRPAAGGTTAEAPSLAALHASLVVFACRSLERTVAVVETRLSGSEAEGVTGTGARSAAAEPRADVSDEESESVEKVLREAEEKDYWVAASRDGNRENHYRGDAIGATLAVRFARCGREGGANARLQALVQRFRMAVDEALPGYYCWFSDQSLHVTVRGICG